MNSLGNKEIMARNIQRLMDRAGKTRMQVCDDLNISYTTLTDWIKGNTYPRIDKIEIMANYFGVSKAELVEDPTTLVSTEDNDLLRSSNRIKELEKENRELTDKLYHLMRYLEDISALIDSKKGVSVTPQAFSSCKSAADPLKEFTEIMRQIYQKSADFVKNDFDNISPEARMEFANQFLQLANKYGPIFAEVTALIHAEAASDQ